MYLVNLNVQGISSPSCIEIISKSLNTLPDINSIHVDWESGRVQIERGVNKSDDIIHLLDRVGYRASLDLDELGNL